MAKNGQILETERLVLKPMEERDIEDLHSIYSNDLVMRFMSTPKHETVAETKKQFHDYGVDKTKLWGIRLKGQETVIGQVHFFSQFRVPGMGYLLHPDYWGKGFVVEATKAVLGYVFKELDVRVIELWIDERNQPSMRVAQKLGFSFKGRLPQQFDHEKEPHVMGIWGLRQSEFFQQQQQQQQIIDNDDDDDTTKEVEFFHVEPVLMVHDVQASAKYFQDQLNFRIDFILGTPPTHASVSRGEWSVQNVTIQLSQIPKEQQIVPSTKLHIRVSDVDKLYALYEKQGANIVTKPVVKPWGFREFVVKDLNGHQLIFAGFGCQLDD